MQQRRVVITGIGVISALGSGREEFWDGLAQGAGGIRPITSVPIDGLRFTQGAEVPDYVPSRFLEDKDITMLDRFAQFAIIAAREAVTDSGLAMPAGAAVVTGSCVGGQCTQDEGFVTLYRDGKSRLNPMTIPRTMANAGASRISLEFGIQGPVYTVSTACSSASHAIGQAFWMVRAGMVDAAITGGSETPFSLGFLKAWEAMRVVSPDTCRPFAKSRKGLILGEGAAMFVLESEAAARARGAQIYGEVCGFGMSSDAHHLTQPTVEGPARAMRSALNDAGWQPEQVGYINAHGTGTAANDVTETTAIRQVFGAHAGRLAVSSTKSLHGHALGAAGALEGVATALALQRGLLPPTVNYDVPDPECDLDVIPNQARVAQVECALSNSFAFGGLNAVLAFRRVEA